MKNLISSKVLMDSIRDKYVSTYLLDYTKPANPTKVDNLDKLIQIVENSKLVMLQNNTNLGVICEQAVIEILKGDKTDNNTNGVDMNLNGYEREIKLVSHNKAHEITKATTMIIVVVTSNVNGVYRISKSDIVKHNLIGTRLNQKLVLKYAELHKGHTNKVFKGITL